MNIDLILPVSVTMGLLGYGMIARFYIMPRIAVLPRTDSLTALLFIHCFRYVGMAFLIAGVTSVAMDPRFANPAAYGDLLAAVLAILSIIALRRGWAIAIPLVLIFNIEGSLDLLNALFQGGRYHTSGEFGATYFIPVVIVPALLVIHYLIFVVLLRRSGSSDLESK